MVKLNEFNHENLINKLYNKWYNFLANNTIKYIKLFVTSDQAEVKDEAYKQFGSGIGFKNSSFNINLQV